LEKVTGNRNVKQEETFLLAGKHTKKCWKNWFPIFSKHRVPIILQTTSCTMCWKGNYLFKYI